MKQCTEAERALLDVIVKDYGNGKGAEIVASLEAVRLERVPQEFFQQCLSTYAEYQRARNLWDQRVQQMHDLGLCLASANSTEHVC